MLYKPASLSLISLGFALSACSTAPDPAKICTTEWIEARADVAIERIERRSDKALSAFRDVADRWMRGETPGPIQMFRLSNAAKDLEKELKDGRAIRDLRLLSSTCNDPDLIRNEIYSLLDRENLPQPLLDFLASSGLLTRLINTAEGRYQNESGS